jgi:hypothetical protein
MSSVIVPRSDQTNSDDLLSGPRTITITGVDIRPGTEQPVSVHYQGDNDRPWKPCKSQCRVMVALWGPDANVYTGRQLTLYCDPKVKWGGVEVGGIRISHASHMEADRTLSLTVTKGQRKPFVVRRMETVSLGSVLTLIAGATTLDALTAAASQAAALAPDDKAKARAAYAKRKAALESPPATTEPTPEPDHEQQPQQTEGFDAETSRLIDLRDALGWDSATLSEYLTDHHGSADAHRDPAKLPAIVAELDRLYEQTATKN